MAIFDVFIKTFCIKYANFHDFFRNNCELLWRQFFFLETPCMDTTLSDFYLAGVHCL